MSFKLYVTSLIAAVVMPVSASAANVLPDALAAELMVLIQGAEGSEIPADIYTLAGDNQPYSDEIACITVQFFGQPQTVKDGIIPLVIEEPQKAAVVSAVMACSQTDVAGGYGVAIAAFTQGIAGGDFNTLSSTTDRASPMFPE